MEPMNAPRNTLLTIEDKYGSEKNSSVVAKHVLKAAGEDPEMILKMVTCPAISFILPSKHLLLCLFHITFITVANLCEITFSCMKCQKFYAEVKHVFTVKLRLKLVKTFFRRQMLEGKYTHLLRFWFLPEEQQHSQPYKLQTHFKY